MVRRRCHWIVLSDAGQDEPFAFEDVGNAIRKIRIDFGINIEIKKMGIFPRKGEKPVNPKYCAVAEICYKDVDGREVENGQLLYIKPAFYGTEPKDIYNYAKTNESCPHQSAGDQWFSESQFESYRALGSYMVSQMCGAKKPEEVNTVAEFIAAAQEYAKLQ